VPPIHSAGLSKGVPSIPALVRYLGLSLLLLSFFLPAVGEFGGFESALWAIGPWPWLHDDKISLAGGSIPRSSYASLFRGVDNAFVLCSSLRFSSLS